MTMNEYGAMAQRHWKQWLPGRYASIDDPGAYFAGLGERAARDIADAWAQMSAAEGNPPGEGYLDRVGRLNMIRKQAEELVLHSLVLLPPEQGADDPEAEDDPPDGT